METTAKVTKDTEQGRLCNHNNKNNGNNNNNNNNNDNNNNNNVTRSLLRSFQKYLETHFRAVFTVAFDLNLKEFSRNLSRDKLCVNV
jgi:hypothetical protein